MLKSNSRVRVLADSVAIFRPSEMRNSNGEPKRFGRPAETGHNPNGYSDHFPITLTLEAN